MAHIRQSRPSLSGRGGARGRTKVRHSAPQNASNSFINPTEVVHGVSSSRVGPVDPSFRALSGRLNFTVQHHKLNKDSLLYRPHKKNDLMKSIPKSPKYLPQSLLGRTSRGGEQERNRLPRGGLIFEAHRLVYHSTPGLRVMKKKKDCSIKRL